jgi:transmembrane sensor
MSTASDFEAQAATWLVRRESSDFSDQEKQAFDAWLQADARHQAAYVRLEAAWRRADRLNRLRPLDGAVDEDLLARSPFIRMEEFSAREATQRSAATSNEAANSRFDDAPGEGAPARASKRRWIAGLSAGIAATIAALAVGLWMAFGHSEWQEYSTDFGGVERIRLEDGSIVHLNTNSVMRVRLRADYRQVVLDRGEALFKVAHDKSRPFDVQAAGTTVRAVGTEFSVRLRESKEVGGGQDGVEVLVKEGRVAIDPPKEKPDQPAALPPSISTLSAGEAVVITAKRLHVEKVADTDVSKKLGWTEGRLWFERQRLADVVAEFNRYNRRQMVIADPSIADLRIGGGFEATDPDSFMAALEKTLGVRAFPANDGTDTIRLVGTHETQSQ